MRRTVLFVALCQISSPASAILGRHDLDPDAYLADESRFAPIGRLDERSEAVLVADRWLVTAAHTVEMLSPFDEPRVRLSQACYRVRNVIVHPEWEGGWPRLHSMHDLALLELEHSVTDIVPLPIYAGIDELGRTVTIAGRGRSGNGRDGLETETDRQMRRGANRIDAVSATTLFMVFDEPDDALALEAVGGPGDSGGPALLEIDGKTYLAGISSATTGVPDVSEGLYGTTDIYTRVSSFAPWVFNTIAGTSVGREWSAAMSCGLDHWPEHPASSLAARLFNAFQEGSLEALLRFYEAVGQRADDAAGRASRLRAGIVERYGAIDIVSCATLGAREIRVLARTRDGSEWFAVGLVGSFEDPSQLERLYLKPQREPGAISRCQQAIDKEP